MSLGIWRYIMNKSKNQYQQGTWRGKGRSFFTTVHLLFLIPLLLLGSNGYAAQTCKASITASTPTSQFQINNNGTVFDYKTQLMWKRCSEGQSWDSVNSTCTGSATQYTWQNALKQAKTVNNGGGFATYTNWRVPNKKELASIVEVKCFYPAINTTLFPTTSPLVYWSASPFSSKIAYYSNRFGNTSWAVNFNLGLSNIYNKSFLEQVRLVRGGN